MPQRNELSSLGTSMRGEIPLKSPNGVNYVFAIGINEYHHCLPLFNAVQDANTLIKVLIERYQFQSACVYKLLNHQATTRNIFQQFDELIDQVKADDRLIIYFSGHGAYKASIDEGYWIPVDGKKEAEETHIPNSAIIKRIGAIKSLHTLLIVDSCFGGSLILDSSVRSVAERIERTPSRYLLSSGRNELVSDGEVGKGSPFSRSLIHHLNHNQQEVLIIDEIFPFIREEVGQNNDQIPIYVPMRNIGHKGGAFTFRLKDAPKPPGPILLPEINLKPPTFSWKKTILILLAINISSAALILIWWMGFVRDSQPVNEVVKDVNSKPQQLADSNPSLDTLLVPYTDEPKTNIKPALPKSGKLMVIPAQLNFGRLGQPTLRKVELRNTGDLPLEIEEIRFDSLHFKVQEFIPFELSGGKSIMITVELIPDRLPGGHYWSQLQIRTEASKQLTIVPLEGEIEEVMDSVYTHIGLDSVRVSFVYQGTTYTGVSDSSGWVKILYPKRIELEDPVQTCIFVKRDKSDHERCNLTHNRIPVPEKFRVKSQNLNQ